MNSVVLEQASKLTDFGRNDDTEAHLYLERMHLPLDVQDQILTAVSGIKSKNVDIVGAEIEHAMETQLSDLFPAK